MNIIDVFYTFFNNPLTQSKYSNYMSALSLELRKKNLSYIRWQNRHSHLLGKLLFIEALKKYGIEVNVWEYVGYNSYQRPFLSLEEYDFNISHSGNFVVCAIGRNVRLGIDIEENKNINFNNFRTVMTDSQWKIINNSRFPIKEFYKFWTFKESASKADGRGISIPFDELEVKNNTISYDNKLWYINEINLDANYSIALATSRLSEFRVCKINF